MNFNIARYDFAGTLMRIHHPAYVLRSARGLRDLVHVEKTPAGQWILGAAAVSACAMALSITLLVAGLGSGLAPPVHLAVTVFSSAAALHAASLITLTAAAAWIGNRSLFDPLIAALAVFAPVAMLVATIQEDPSPPSVVGNVAVTFLIAVMVRLFSIPRVVQRLTS